MENAELRSMQADITFEAEKNIKKSQGKSMSKYDSDYSEKKSHAKHKSPKFRDYYDDEFTEEDEKELHSRKKKLGKKPKRKKTGPDWPAEE